MSITPHKKNPGIRKLAMQLVRHHYPRKKIQIEALGGGITNFVYLVKAGKEEIVVRIAEDRGKINSFLKEQWAVTRAREKKIPVPEILEVGNTVIPLPYMISSKVRGTVALNHPRRKEILCEMGGMAARIHEIETNGYGQFFDWSSNTLSKNVKWKDFLNGELDFPNRLAILKKLRMVSTRSLQDLKTEIRKMSGWKAAPCLQHGDLRLKNVLVDKFGKITAIIDWEECISAIGPAWDISIALHDLPIEGQQRFLEGYGLPEKKFSILTKALKTFNILNYAPVVQGLSERGEANQLRWHRSRMHGEMDLFSL